MKFFKILQGQGRFSPEDIATEIVVLEGQLPEFEDKLQEAEKKAVRFRRAKLSGEAIADKDLEKADRDFELARLDLKTATATLEELNTKLKAEVEKTLEEEGRNLDAEKERIKEEKSKAKIDLARLMASVKAMQIYIGEYNEQPPRHGSGDFELRGSIYTGTPEYGVFIDEVEARLKEMEKSGLPIRNRQSELDRRVSVLEEDVDTTIANTLNKARENGLPG